MSQAHPSQALPSEEVPKLPKDLRWALPPHTRGTGIAICSTPVKSLYAHIVTVNEEPYGTDEAKFNPDFLVKDVSDLPMFASRSFDFVVVNIFYEDNGLEKPLKEYWRLIKQEGKLLVYVKKESPEMVSAIKTLKDAQVIEVLVSETEVLLVILKSKLIRLPIDPGVKKAAVIRYGAFGDMMRAASVCAGLKALGYRVSLHCSPPGCDIVKHDPNIDELVITDKDQVRNEDLTPYWEFQKTLYDKWVNLCESEEGALLEMTGHMSRPGPQWSPALREKHKSWNYLEFQHDIGGIPYVPAVKFYPAPEEKQWAHQERAKIKTKGVIMWQFEGSSVNKVWCGETQSGFDQTIARIMTAYDDVSVVITGGTLPPFNFDQWANEPRFINKRGAWTMRQTLSFLDQVDLVVGPETGTLTAASQLEVPKIIFLSHSTVKNLTRDWVNTISLTAPYVECPGRGKNEAKACHQLHYGWSSCKQHKETGTAECMAGITIEMAWDAIAIQLSKKFKFSSFYMKNVLKCS
jgi:ADP-heptose:LPS heptosyltransferase